MKRLISTILITLLLLTGCEFGDVSEVKITEVRSSIYSENDINQALSVIKNYFRVHFKGCRLIEIGYIGDEHDEEMKEWAEAYNADECILLISDFYVSPDGGDCSLNTDDTYENWKWILVRDQNGRWEHKDHGYG